MNLHALVAPAIGLVNPRVSALIYASTGSVTQPDGKRVPSFAAPVTCLVQAQALSSRDLAHTDNLNLQGIMKKFWIDGAVFGVVRKDGTGGDVIVLAGMAWLVTTVVEVWPDWCSVIATQQLALSPGVILPP